MSADALISRLEKCRRTGAGTWLACCPAHEDKSPSMSIREVEDGRVLVHCFAGCGVDEILGAVGLSFDALFPPKPIEHAQAVRRPFPAADVLEALSFECIVIAVHAGQLARGESLTEKDKARMWLAFDRFEEGRRLALG